MRRILTAFFAAAALGVAAAPADARQAVCDSRTKILDHLDSKYSEKPVALGMAANGSLVEILSTDDGATWTIVITHPNGTTCLMAAGEHWETLPQVAYGEES